MNAGKNEADIIQKILTVIDDLDNQGKIKNGPNTIHTSLNNTKVENKGLY